MMREATFKSIFSQFPDSLGGLDLLEKWLAVWALHAMLNGNGSVADFKLVLILELYDYDK